MAFIIFNANFQFMRISGQSMDPTLHNNQWKLVSKLTNEYQHENIVVFNTTQYGTCVKRIIGRSGDVIELKNGYLWRNKVKLTNYRCQRSKNNVYELKDNQYFMVGDNYNASIDSRDYGIVESSQIIGKLAFMA